MIWFFVIASYPITFVRLVWTVRKSDADKHRRLAPFYGLVLVLAPVMVLLDVLLFVIWSIGALIADIAKWINGKKEDETKK